MSNDPLRGDRRQVTNTMGSSRLSPVSRPPVSQFPLVPYIKGNGNHGFFPLPAVDYY